MRLGWTVCVLVALVARGEGAVRAGVLGPGGRVHLSTSATPPVLGAEELARRAARRARAHRSGPDRGLAAPATSTELVHGPRLLDACTTSTFRVLRDDDLRSVVPAADTAEIGEPCALRAERDLFAVGNWYAAVSTDGGASYRHVDPATAFPAADNGFCCDQSVIYEPTRRLFVWELMYSPSASGNRLRLAIAHGAAAFEAGDWQWFDLTPQDLGVLSGHWLDYPQLALGTAFLYVSVNVFRTSDDTFTDAAVVRIPLDDLAAGGRPSFSVFRVADHFTLTPVQGAHDVMYFAAQESGSYATHVYRWPENTSAVSETSVPVRSYANTGMICPGPDGRDWCKRSDDRIMTGWVAGGVVGFMWNAAQDASHPFPYVRTVRLREADLTLLDEPDIADATTAYQYPAVAVNARGHLGGVVVVGGGTRYPGTAAFLADDLTVTATPWELHDLVTGTSGPSGHEWGDFLCSRPDWGDGTTWVVTGFALDGGVGTPHVHPHVDRVGRERDIVCGPDQACPDDGEPCTTAVCNGGHCTSPALADGTACDDHDVCSLAELCQAGCCTPTDMRTCTDDDPCTDDQCNGEIGCIFPERSGYDGVTCAFERGLPTSACGSRALPPRVSRLFTRAQTQVELARATPGRRGQRHRLHVAASALTRARLRVRGARLDASCRHALLAALRDTRRRVRSYRRGL